MLFRDRHEAGRVLAGRLTGYAGRASVTVLGLARGGVPVAREVADRIDAPLDVFSVRKLAVPGHEELAMGAIASGGVLVVNDELVQALGIPAAVLEEVAEAAHRELRRRELVYRGERPPTAVRGRIVILVDDGLATGSTMRAAVAALRGRAPGRIVVAAPVGAPAACHDLAALADEVVCPMCPEPFFGVDAFYRDFAGIGDRDVHEALAPRAPTLAAG